MILSQWLDMPDQNGKRRRRREFAERIGVSPSMITDYCSGASWPSREVMENIRRETNGDVTANDFLTPADAPAQPQAVAP